MISSQIQGMYIQGVVIGQSDLYSNQNSSLDPLPTYPLDGFPLNMTVPMSLITNCAGNWTHCDRRIKSTNAAMLWKQVLSWQPTPRLTDYAGGVWWDLDPNASSYICGEITWRYIKRDLALDFTLRSPIKHTDHHHVFRNHHPRLPVSQSW